jgi:3D (Asp-Asp-Asp) domain-containing protein
VAEEPYEIKPERRRFEIQEAALLHRLLDTLSARCGGRQTGAPMMRLVLAYLALIAALFLPIWGNIGERQRLIPFLATAYTMQGTTKSGLPTQPGTVAADTSVLPLGTQIKVTNAGPHSGIYTVTDSGGSVKGRHIDIFVPTWARAKNFGRKVVQVTVLKWGQWEEKED